MSEGGREEGREGRERDRGREEGKKGVVLEPDPRKIGKEGLAHRLGWKCTLRNVRNFINC